MTRKSPHRDDKAAQRRSRTPAPGKPVVLRCACAKNGGRDQ